MQINENQKAVSATLRITLEEDLYWLSDRVDLRIRALRSSIIQTLGESTLGPLYNKIAIGEDKAPLAAKPFAAALNSSGLLPTVKYNKYTDEGSNTSLYDTNNLDHESEMLRARNSVVGFLNLCYEFVREEYPDIFDDEWSFILSNRGTYAFLNLVGSLNSYLTQNDKVTVHTAPEERCDKMKEYLRALLNSLRTISVEEEERLFANFGSGADNRWFRFFQELVHRVHADYNPPDLVDWMERQDIELQNYGRHLGENIEKHIKKTVIDTLQTLFGDNWDLEIGEIQRQCEVRASEETEKRFKEGLGRTEIPWTDMFFVTDYKKIIEKYWSRNTATMTSFAEVFSIDIGKGFNSKQEKIKWLSVFNSYRNNWAHAGTREKGLNREEVSFLEKIHDHLGLSAIEITPYG